MSNAEARFTAIWENKTCGQLQKEILSWRKYMQKHNAAYNFHGNAMTAPGELSDGDRLCILRRILKEKGGIENE